jgi:hypothetical protein
MANIDDFFRKNGVVPKSLTQISDEHIRVHKIKDPKEYYREFSKTGFDDFIDCVNYYPNRLLFVKMLEALEGVNDVFEPCCGSGLLGSYLNLNMGDNSHFSYNGIDSSEYAIEKAKERAVLNALNPDLFCQEDVFDYETRHELIVGRHVVNNRYAGVNRPMVEKLCTLSDHMFFIQTNYGNMSDDQCVDMYRDEFAKYDFEVESLIQKVKVPSTMSFSFVIEVTKQ